MNETDLRAMLASEADRFQPDPAWLTDVSRPPQIPRQTLIGVAVGVAAVLIGTMVYFTDRAPTVPRMGPTVQPVYIRLAGYVSNKGASVPADLQRHIDCMRDQGFDLPQPRRVANGWELKIDDPEALGLGSARWKRAAFDTCALVRNRAVYDRWIRRAIFHHRLRHP